MGLPRPNERDLDGDESVISPRHSQESLLAAKRGTDETKRIETDASGNLYVNVAAGSITTSEITVQALANGSVTAVTSPTLTTVVTFTAVAASKITRIGVSGTVTAKYQLFLNTVLIETKRFAPGLQGDFVFSAPLALAPGDILDVKVTHFHTGRTEDFDATVYGA